VLSTLFATNGTICLHHSRHTFYKIYEILIVLLYRWSNYELSRRQTKIK